MVLEGIHLHLSASADVGTSFTIDL